MIAGASEDIYSHELHIQVYFNSLEHTREMFPEHEKYEL